MAIVKTIDQMAGTPKPSMVEFFKNFEEYILVKVEVLEDELVSGRRKIIATEIREISRIIEIVMTMISFFFLVSENIKIIT